MGARFAHTSLHGPAIGKPASADQERAFIRSVIVSLAASYQPIFAEDPFGSVDRPRNSCIGNRQEAHLGQAQEARVDLVRTEGLNEIAGRGIEAVSAYSRMDIIPQRFKLMTPRSTNRSARRELEEPINANPGHHLRIGEVPRRPLRFPDASVGPLPDAFDMVDNGLFNLDLPRPILFDTRLFAHVEQIKDLAIDVELHLLRGRISNPDRPCSFIAGRPRNLVC